MPTSTSRRCVRPRDGCVRNRERDEPNHRHNHRALRLASPRAAAPSGEKAARRARLASNASPSRRDACAGGGEGHELRRASPLARARESGVTRLPAARAPAWRRRVRRRRRCARLDPTRRRLGEARARAAAQSPSGAVIPPRTCTGVWRTRVDRGGELVHHPQPGHPVVEALEPRVLGINAQLEGGRRYGFLQFLDARGNFSIFQQSSG